MQFLFPFRLPTYGNGQYSWGPYNRQLTYPHFYTTLKLNVYSILLGGNSDQKPLDMMKQQIK
jgi:hypothetical protein